MFLLKSSRSCLQSINSHSMAVARPLQPRILHGDLHPLIQSTARPSHLPFKIDHQCLPPKAIVMSDLLPVSHLWPLPTVPRRGRHMDSITLRALAPGIRLRLLQFIVETYRLQRLLVRTGRRPLILSIFYYPALVLPNNLHGRRLQEAWLVRRSCRQYKD